MIFAARKIARAMKANGTRHCQTHHAADAPSQRLSRRATARRFSQTQHRVTHGQSKNISHHCLCASPHLIGPGAAQEWAGHFPARRVTIVVPSPPGSGTDLLARLLADQLSKRWSKAVIVENGSGVAAGNVAAADFARSSPDGYTLMLCPPGPISTNGLLYEHLNYDPQKNGW